MLEEDLVSLQRQGYIPGPKETEASFWLRIQVLREYYEKKEEGPLLLNEDEIKKASLFTHTQYDFTLDKVKVFYSDKELTPWQGAALWLTQNKGIALPLIQLKKGFQKGRYFFYSRDEVLGHELSHAARMAFHEPQFEEILAYRSSKNLLRRYLGPLFQNSLESFLFLTAVFICGIYLGYSDWPFSGYAFSISLAWMGFLFARLVLLQALFCAALYKIRKTIKNPVYAHAVLFRLTDEEIKKFAFKKPEDIKSYFEERINADLRLKMVYLSYF